MSAGSTESTAAEAQPAAATTGGAVLTDKPADAGERPVQMTVYNSPAEYEAATGEKIAAFNEAPELAEAVAKGELPAVAERLTGGTHRGQTRRSRRQVWRDHANGDHRPE
ncbi:MAG: hypothetical protein V9G24_16520 [Rhodoblastus sp.]